MTKSEEIKRHILEKIESYVDVESLPFLLIYPEKYREWTQAIFETDTKENPNSLLEIAEFLNAITQMSIVFTYSDEDSKLINMIISKLISEKYIYQSVDAEAIESKSRFPSGRDFDNLFPYSPGDNSHYLFVKALYTQPSLKKYKDFDTLQKLFYSKGFLFYRYEINWTKFKSEVYREYDYFEPISLDINIKSQKKVQLTLFPKLKHDPIYTQLVYKYGDNEPIKISFEFNKGYTPLALLALFLYTRDNKQSAILTSSTAKDILNSYKVIIDKDNLDSRRVMKYLHEKIKKLNNDKAINHLLHIFPVRGNFLRLETSLELSKAQQPY